MGSRGPTRSRRENSTAPTGADCESHGRLHANLFDGQLYVPGSDIHTQETPSLLHVQHLHSHMLDCRHVLGIVLDKTRSGTSTCHSWRHLIADPFDPTRQVTGITAASVVFKSGGRFYVGLHNVSVQITYLHNLN
jgi:hypothetical protein